MRKLPEIVVILLIGVHFIHCQQNKKPEPTTEESLSSSINASNSEGYNSSGTSRTHDSNRGSNSNKTVGRRRQGNKQRNHNGNISTSNNKHGWGQAPKRKSGNSHNYDPVISSSDNPHQSRRNIGENPLFPPRTDSFWKNDKMQSSRVSHQPPSSSSNNGKRHGKRRQHVGGGGADDRAQSLDAKGRTTAPSSSPIPGTDDDLKERPNIILIITDDQDVELGSMNYMPETLKEFQDNGIEFRHGYVTTPMCCPSRSSMLTGLYVHNHQVFTNNDNCSSILWRQKYERKTFAHLLHESGYYTSYIGKYLNKYDGSHIPAGWDEWNALLMNSRFYNYTVNRNGRTFRYGNTYEYDYYPDSITNDTLDFLDRAGVPTNGQSFTTTTPISSTLADEVLNDEEDEEFHNHEDMQQAEEIYREKKMSPRKPFLLVASYPSPHGPEDSAPQYSNLFLNSTPHHTPSYNYAPNLDKQWILRVTERMNPQLETFTNLLMTKRLQTLQSVDLAVKQIFDKLRETKLIDNTYIFYTSDHGYHVGQFGLIKGKSMPYEFDIRVPFYVRAPANQESASSSASSNGKNIRIMEPVLNIDLAPTFLEIGRVPVPPWVDGRSMLPLINLYTSSNKLTNSRNTTTTFLQPSWGHTFIIESSGRREPIPDPTESLNKRRKMPRKKFFEDDDTLSNLCVMHPYPCQPQQKKYCKMERNRIRFRKCRIGFDYQMFNISKCSCLGQESGVARRRRRRGVRNWDEQRHKIDEEIEVLQKKIKSLREKRKKLRDEWLGTRNNVSYSHVTRDGFEWRVSRRNKEVLGGASRANNNKEELWHIDDDEDDLLEEEEIPVVFHHSEEEDDSLDNEDGVLLEFPPSSSTQNKGSHRQGFGDRKSNSNSKRKTQKSNTRGSLRGPLLLLEEDGAVEKECDCQQPALSASVLKQFERDERKRRKLMSKIRKKQRFLNRIDDPRVRQQAETCGTEEKMNCFWHDADHWRTPPLWHDGSFCFCMNSNNNTFTCLRSINSTHNYLYCHFITGFKMYFNLKEDPYELRNLIATLPASSEDWMLNKLLHLKSCQGSRNCWPDSVGHSTSSISQSSDGDQVTETTTWQQIRGRWKGGKKSRNGRRQKHY